MTEADVTKLPSLADLSGSLAERVYVAVKAAILALDFPPGAVIRKAQLCARTGLSRSPVSEALTKLSGEGLVDIAPRSGTRVSRLSMEAIRECAFLREALEVAAARHAATDPGPQMLATLEANLTTQRDLIAHGQMARFFQIDTAFHDTIMATTGITRLPATVRALSQHVDRARMLLLPEPGRLAETLDEHTRIVEALRARDPARAEAAMRTHLRQLIKRLEPLETAQPDLFTT